MDGFDQNFLLAWARDAAKDHTLWDFHIHPYDVLSGDTTCYQLNPEFSGVYSRATSKYHPPQISELDLKTKTEVASKPKLSDRCLLLLARSTYTHIGPKVITDQLDLCGISNALLLQVSRTHRSVEQLLESADTIYSQEKRLRNSTPTPIGLDSKDTFEFYRSAYERWKIAAIKIHPNLSNINPLSESGRELIEITLESAGTLNLPVTVHGGPSIGVETAEAMEYALLDRLQMINWSLAKSPVIIAHGGMYNLSFEEELETLKTLNAMLEKHSNLYIDTSNLNFEIISLLINKSDRKRLIFGSDALYKPVWEIWVQFLYALRLASPQPDQDMIQIASTNPSQCIGINKG